MNHYTQKAREKGWTLQALAHRWGISDRSARKTASYPKMRDWDALAGVPSRFGLKKEAGFLFFHALFIQPSLRIHLESVARKKLEAPDAWRILRWELLSGGEELVVDGGIPRDIRWGRAKGRILFDGPLTRILVSLSDVRKEVANYEAQTGLCGGCLGAGRITDYWDITEGEVLRDCPKCKGTGNKKDGPD
ncbi:hypothetical protein [Trichloromonas sp.]|uniref:hypothetical protein n=1 Tax=Trichloromonas sp. TaxID=3069249 RepID=UPI002A3B624D|nr:hypothetical protein [Trichloromonas sp.]